ncbi:hypothetical protein BST61_g4240 [Cercospora zeina]
MFYRDRILRTDHRDCDPGPHVIQSSCPAEPATSASSSTAQPQPLHLLVTNTDLDTFAIQLLAALNLSLSLSLEHQYETSAFPIAHLAGSSHAPTTPRTGPSERPFNMFEDIFSAEWRKQWTYRTLPELENGSLVVVSFLLMTAMMLSLQMLSNLLTIRSKLSSSSSSQTSILISTREALLHHFSKRQFTLSVLFALFAISIWIVDVIVGSWEIYSEVSDGDKQYPEGFWFQLGIRVLGMMCVLIATMIAVPLVQIVGFGLWMQSKIHSTCNRIGENDELMLSSAAVQKLLPQARTIATYSQLFWSAGFFCIVAFWSPMAKNFIIRSVILQGAVGSVNAWSHASFGLIWRAEKLRQEVLEEDVRLLGARAMTEKCLSEMKRIYVEEEKQALLPK